MMSRNLATKDERERERELSILAVRLSGLINTVVGGSHKTKFCLNQ